MNTDMVLILGTTASGKGPLAFELARAINGEIISVDSMKVYRRMDIGTAKPPRKARTRIKYHLIDVVEPSESFSAGAFSDAALAAIEDIKRRNRPVIAVGGTALYLKALLYGLFRGPGSDKQIRENLRARAQTEGLKELYSELSKIDPDAAEHIHPNDSKRIIRALEVHMLTGKPISKLQKQFSAEKTLHHWTLIGLDRDKTDVNSRINRRVKEMMAAGLLDEVQSLLAEDKPLSTQARSAIGYAEMISCLNGQISLENAIELIKKNTRRLAKNQRTWFKTFINVNWLDIDAQEPPGRIFDRTMTLLNKIE